ncbi:MAG: carbohydrate ABC transporter permease [Candidatus Latescibacteria bacterium]|jgi:multiple sugar transport system permease protein|nr:sugar ABC transporter permease [Gemmatimonadaceae bacterium]MDP6015701.1 carbohydrate ABC transporter permease [Candidatus Latescibacterota bacterium]MDP7449855.1 carbohydrate ABC transporter permease [Candidatus Latescibacterota bacterium]HJP29003.1 carbohydrate ABC transporter permease [Candidatus Latescibacterota bacterium]
MAVLRWSVLTLYGSLATLPLLWLAMTAIKSRVDSIATTARFVPVADGTGIGPGSIRFEATLEGFRALGDVYAGAAHPYYHYLMNTLVIGSCSTVAAVLLGTSCAYGFSRFRIPGARDWLFFILSTRFLPPLAVVIPILMMYRSLGLPNTHLGLIILYTAFNLSLAVWLMKGFIDDIPAAYEEAALVDGYTRWQAFVRVVLPRALPGMAVTAVFCLISAWNEYGFAMTLNNRGAVTVPVYFAGLQGNVQGMPWSQVGAGVLLFVSPIVLFTVLVRKHLLRGVTFGTIKQ